MGRILALSLMCLAACSHATDPEDAFRRVERALAAGDGMAIFPYLDQPTRWAIQSAFEDQRMMRTIITAKYPEEEQARALQPLTAAEEIDVSHYFAHVVRDRHTCDQYRPRLGSASGPIMLRADGPSGLWIARQDGRPFHFARDSRGNWGWSELGQEWALEKDRANHAVKTVRDNAALYNKGSQ
jgi:hypothetical protein